MMTSHTSIAVIIPAATCPCDQIARISSQLSETDQLVLVYNGPAIGHECAATIRDKPRCTSLQFPKRLGPAAARNIGVAAISGRTHIYAFADADDRVAPTWLANLTAPLIAGSADVVGGGLLIRRRRGKVTVLPAKDYWYRQALFGGNLALMATAWHTLKGFDTSLQCCEDTDLAWRAATAGLRIQVEPSAIVDVNTRHPAREAVQRFLWGRWSVSLLGRHQLGIDHLPTLRQLISHKRANGCCRWPLVAATSQWSGQLSGRWQQWRRGSGKPEFTRTIP